MRDAVSSPRPIDIDLESGEKISSGNDSNVFRIGDRVAKEYHSLSFEAVARYVALQNAAAEAIPRLSYGASFPVGGLPYQLQVMGAIPVEELGLSALGRPLALSRFADGPNLEKIMYKPEAFEAWAVDHLGDPSVYAPARDLNHVFWTEYPTRAQDEFHYHVAMLSRLLDHELGVSGLYISKYNVKLSFEPSERRINLVVTDLALYIDRVTYAR